MPQRALGLVPAVAANARLSNAVGDLALGLGHLAGVAWSIQSLLCLRRHRTKGEDAARARSLGDPRSSSKKRGARLLGLGVLVPGYLFALAVFQLMGLAYHLFAPCPAAMDRAWWAYLVAGALSQGLYGAALSLDLLDSFRAVAAWLLYTAAYVALASIPGGLDLAQVRPLSHVLPSAHELVVPARVAAWCARLPWMPSALRLNGVAEAGSAPLTLRFDGRGYAAVPFAEIFDARHAATFDLVAPFPCWRTDSLTLLMLCVGVFSNCVHIAICRHARDTTSSSGAGNDTPSSFAARRVARATRLARGHCFMGAALVTMPAAMLLGGVQAGIDWMHLCASPSMLAQALSCLEALDDECRFAVEGDDDASRRRPSSSASTRQNGVGCGGAPDSSAGEGTKPTKRS